MKVNYVIVLPAVQRQWPSPSDSERYIANHLNIGCNTWQTNTAMRKGFCERIFAGAGNHPGTQAEGGTFDWWRGERARSMSVGDLIHLDPKGLNEWWVCDSIGFILMTESQALAWLAWPGRKYGCCSFELSEWLDSVTQLA